MASRKRKHKKIKHRLLHQSHAIQPVAPEDIHAGDYLALTHRSYQLLPDSLENWGGNNTVKTVRVDVMPCDSGEPMRVLAVCLPFITAVSPHRFVTTIDLRREHVGRLPKAYGRHVFKQHRNV